jgi:site-specific DNA recombinase
MSGADIKTKMANKARNGGTLGPAKLGYLNVSKTIDGHKVNTVAVDENIRALVLACWELCDTGDYTIDTLQQKVTELGLRTRATGRWPSGPVSRSKLAKMLRDRYYIGKVTYDGIEYDGRTSRWSHPSCSSAYSASSIHTKAPARANAGTTTISKACCGATAATSA